MVSFIPMISIWYLNIIAILILLFIQIKLSYIISKKCKDIQKRNLHETGLYYKDGTPVKRGYDIVFAWVILLMIPAIILTTILIGELGLLKAFIH